MRPRGLKNAAVLFCCFAQASAFAGCGSGAPAAAPAPASASTTVSIAGGGGTADFPLVGGYTGTFVYGPNNAGGATAVMTTSVAPRAFATAPGSFQPAGVQLASFTFQLNERARFAGWHSLPSTITLPAMFPVAGRQFLISAYDLTRGLEEGENVGVPSGTQIVFPSYSTRIDVTLGTDKSLFVLTVQ